MSELVLDAATLVAEPAGWKAFKRLGLRVLPTEEGHRSFVVGAPRQWFAIESAPPEGLTTPRPSKGLYALRLHGDDLDAVWERIRARGLPSERDTTEDTDCILLPFHEQVGVALVLDRTDEIDDAICEEVAEQGWLNHTFPLKRLDHLALITHDLEARTRFWVEVLGVPVVGEVATSTLKIRQLRLGDAILELLGPANLDSPLWQRPPGLVSMASFEVPELDKAVALARSRDFTVSEPETGVLPGTRIATIADDQLGGLRMQLLEYV